MPAHRTTLQDKYYRLFAGFAIPVRTTHGTVGFAGKSRAGRIVPWYASPQKSWRKPGNPVNARASPTYNTIEDNETRPGATSPRAEEGETMSSYTPRTITRLLEQLEAEGYELDYTSCEA